MITLSIESLDSFLANVFITLLDVMITLSIESLDSFLANVLIKKLITQTSHTCRTIAVFF